MKDAGVRPKDALDRNGGLNVRTEQTQWNKRKPLNKKINKFNIAWLLIKNIQSNCDTLWPHVYPPLVFRIRSMRFIITTHSCAFFQTRQKILFLHRGNDKFSYKTLFYIVRYSLVLQYFRIFFMTDLANMMQFTISSLERGG